MPSSTSPPQLRLSVLFLSSLARKSSTARFLSNLLASLKPMPRRLKVLLAEVRELQEVKVDVVVLLDVAEAVDAVVVAVAVVPTVV